MTPGFASAGKTRAANQILFIQALPIALGLLLPWVAR